MASGRLADYLGKGDASDRPVSLSLHPEAIGFWYSEDTGELSAWDGAAWVENIAGSAPDAEDVPYDNSTSGLTASDVQAAIDELVATPPGSATAATTSYDNAASGLTAMDVQEAIDELAAMAPGSGDVEGPGSAVDSRIAVFDGTSGKKIKDGGTTVAALLASAVAIKITTSISSGTITPAGDTDIVRASALSAALAIANPSSTPQDGWGMVIELKDNGTARALTWGTKYASRIGTLPTTTVAGKQHVVGVSYNATDDKLYCDFAVVQA